MTAPPQDPGIRSKDGVFLQQSSPSRSESTTQTQVRQAASRLRFPYYYWVVPTFPRLAIIGIADMYIATTKDLLLARESPCMHVLTVQIDAARQRAAWDWTAHHRPSTSLYWPSPSLGREVYQHKERCPYQIPRCPPTPDVLGSNSNVPQEGKGRFRFTSLSSVSACATRHHQILCAIGDAPSLRTVRKRRLEHVVPRPRNVRAGLVASCSNRSPARPAHQRKLHGLEGPPCCRTSRTARSSFPRVLVFICI